MFVYANFTCTNLNITAFPTLQVACSYGEDFKALGGEILLNYEVTDFTPVGAIGEIPKAAVGTKDIIKDFSKGVVVHGRGDVPATFCRHIITCAGANSDRGECLPTPYCHNFLILSRITLMKCCTV